MPDLTTLQLAELIAEAVAAELSLHTHDDSYLRWSPRLREAQTHAVLRVLHETDSWFCRLKETPHGTVETAYEQVELFP